jgi:hypothetical protein
VTNTDTGHPAETTRRHGRAIWVQLAIVLTFGFVSLGWGFGTAASSAAEPYSRPVTVSIDTTAPPESGTVLMVCQHLRPYEIVFFTLHTTPYLLGSAQADSRGTLTATFQLPAGFLGDHTIVVTNRAGTAVARIAVTIGGAGASNSAAVGGGGGGGLAYTGFAVAGVAALGVVLTVTGVLMMYTGRSRTTARHRLA